MSQRDLGSVRLQVPFGGDGKFLEVWVSGLALVSCRRSEQELRKFDIDRFVEQHLQDIADQRNSLPGFRQALQESGDTIIGEDLFLHKKKAQVTSTLRSRIPSQIDISPDGPTVLLART